MVTSTVMGCDFSSAPRRAKPIVLAWGQVEGDCVRLERLQTCTSLDDWSAALHQPGPWIGGFDLPFGLPRELVTSLGWPQDWAGCMDYYASLERSAIRAQFAAFCNARPVGGKWAHRATDWPAGASPSMRWVNPPVALMLHAGLPRLRAAGLHLPGLAEGDPSRVGLEAYPGMLAREVLGRESYKSDTRAKQTPERRQARERLLQALRTGQTRLALRLDLGDLPAQELLADGSGDRLDAVLCMLQAGWAARAHAAGAALYGLPPQMDRLEGWIVSANADDLQWPG